MKQKRNRTRFSNSFAAESHVDRSIENPKNFIESNIVGTFNLIDSVEYYEKLCLEKKKLFLFHRKY